MDIFTECYIRILSTISEAGRYQKLVAAVDEVLEV